MSKFESTVRSHGWLLVAAFLVLAPVKTLYEGPMALMALAGLVLFAIRPAAMWRAPGVKLLLVLFGLVWLPMALSLPDAVEPGRATSTALTFLRFPLAGAFICVAMTEAAARRRLLMAAGVILAFWSIDGVIQAIAGTNLLGNPMIGGRLTGIYYPRLTLGHALATFSPLMLYWVWKIARQRGLPWLILVAPLVVTVFMAGGRVGWMMLALSLVLMTSGWLLSLQRADLKKVLPMLLLCLGLAGGYLLTQPDFQQRLAGTAGVLSGNAEKFNQATSLRLGIWQAGVKMFGDYWINGVGPRGFRYIYGHYSQEGDVFFKGVDEPGPTHPHQLVLEIGVETGVIGLLGYLLFLGLYCRRAIAAIRARVYEAAPWMAAAFISFFPLNAGHAFYGGRWSCIVWWLTALAVAHMVHSPPSAPDREST